MEKEAVCGVYLCLQQLQLFLFHISGNLREKKGHYFPYFSVYLSYACKIYNGKDWKGQVQLTATVVQAEKPALTTLKRPKLHKEDSSNC